MREKTKHSGRTGVERQSPKQTNVPVSRAVAVPLFFVFLLHDKVAKACN